MRTALLTLLLALPCAAYPQTSPLVPPAPDAPKAAHDMGRMGMGDKGEKGGMGGMAAMAGMGAMHGRAAVCLYEGKAYSAGALLHVAGVRPILECASPALADEHAGHGGGADHAAHQPGAGAPAWRIYQAASAKH